MTTHTVAAHSVQPTTDLLIVGAGIIGLATAFCALEEGRTVRIVDAAGGSAGAVGASIQNFGHACVTAQSDLIQPVAQASRAGWLRAAAAAGFWAREAGTWVPAVTEVEAQVLDEFAHHRGSQQVRLIGRDDVAAALGNPDLAAVSGAHFPRDLRVNPREVVPVLTRYLADQGVEFVWNARALHVGDGTVETTAGTYAGTQVVVAPGHQLSGLFPQLAQRHQVRVCELVMSMIRRPAHTPEDLSVLTGTSLARYDGIAAMPSVTALREELVQREPRLVDCVANLMMTGTADHVLIGDSHAYSQAPDPFIDAEIAQLLLDRGCAYLGIEKPCVVQRWKGTYADSAQTNLVLERPDAATTVAVVTSGIGMTLSFGIAELILSGGNVAGF